MRTVSDVMDQITHKESFAFGFSAGTDLFFA
jgi:hypothetical protein